MRSPWVTVAAWLIGPPTAGAVVWLLGEAGSLGWPPTPLHRPESIAAGGPAVALLATLRLAVVAACAVTTVRVILAILCVALSGSTPRHHRRYRSSDSLVRALRRIVRPAAVAGLGVSLVSVPGFASGAAATDEGTSSASQMSPPVVDRDEGVESGGDAAAVEGDTGRSFARMRRIRIEFAPFAQPDSGSDVRDEWVVERGDHLWSIAAENLAEHLGETPSEGRIARYWLRLIEANRDRLVLPHEPDVIVPGQRLVLPRPGGGAAQRSGT